jgi:hypothetical protein
VQESKKACSHGLLLLAFAGLLREIVDVASFVCAGLAVGLLMLTACREAPPERWDVLQEFRITKIFAADERRHAAIPKTVAMIRFWAMISPLLVPRSCPLRIMCITSKPLRALQAVRKEPNPKQYLARLLTNR